jgi:glycerophosphoryl diester phosphodiesterase
MSVLLMAHRGIPWQWPENSLLSFSKAIEVGADILEFDVRLAADGVPIIMHDATLDRTTDGSGPVAACSYQDLRARRIHYAKTVRHDVGEAIPTLEDVVGLLLENKTIQANCEIKDYSDSCIDQTLAMFASAGLMARSVFTCFDYTVLSRIKNHDASIRVQGFPLEMMDGVPNGADPRGFDHVGLKFSAATTADVAWYKDRGVTTGVWVVNHMGDLQNAVEMGVDFVCTDRVDTCARYLHNTGPDQDGSIGQ